MLLCVTSSRASKWAWIINVPSIHTNTYALWFEKLHNIDIKILAVSRLVNMSKASAKVLWQFKKTFLTTTTVVIQDYSTLTNKCNTQELSMTSYLNGWQKKNLILLTFWNDNTSFIYSIKQFVACGLKRLICCNVTPKLQNGPVS